MLAGIRCVLFVVCCSLLAVRCMSLVVGYCVLFDVCSV